MWWRSQYIYRRSIAITAPSAEDVPQSHPVTVALDWSLFDSGKMRTDFADVEVVFVNADGENVHLYREVESTEDAILVRFQLAEDLARNTTSIDQYYIYYGNLDLVDVPTRPAVVTIEGVVFDAQDPLRDSWPVSVLHNGNLVTYTRPGEHWKEGASSRVGARAAVQIYCTKFRIVSEAGPDKGIMEVQLDGGEWEEVSLYQPTPTEAAVYEALLLDPAVLHEIRVRVTGRMSPSARDSEVNVKRFEYSKPVALDDMGEQVNDLVWSSSLGGA